MKAEVAPKGRAAQPVDAPTASTRPRKHCYAPRISASFITWAYFSTQAPLRRTFIRCNGSREATGA